MILYAVSIFLSAFLLFQVQPLIAKIILPWFGGSAAVWSAALLFFQLVLLAGYGYAHVLIRYLSAKSQMMVHAALLLISCALLPIYPSTQWQPVEAGDPTIRILGLLAVTIGLPYFLLSSTSPLLQAWYVRRSGSGMPYRLFALSNFGSMLALISFPFAVEPTLTSHQQAYTWSGVYVLFAGLCAYTAWLSTSASALSDGRASMTEQESGGERPGFLQMLLWVALAACASTLLVSVTNHLSQNVAPIPLLWVVPLALYLGTFILSFESDRIYQRWIFLPLLAPALGGMAYMIWTDSGNLPIKRLIPGFAAGLFICCMMCHGELARRRPATKYLTQFYLMISLGGAIGGIFVALIAPRVFHSNLELEIALVATAVLTTIVLWRLEMPTLGSRLLRFVLMIGVGALAGYLVRHHREEAKEYRLSERNFYGVLRTKDEHNSNLPTERVLMHGTINHGSQVQDDKFRYKPISYYGPESGLGRSIRALQQTGPIRVGVIGLGAGVTNAYARAGDFYRVYEINPLVERIAQTEFTYFPHSPADKRILLGDARLTMERQESQQFDLIAVDAFSSDAIPIHLLTREAFAVYFRQLKPNGILALHISNRYLDLAPVCARGAQEFGKTATTVSNDVDDDNFILDSTWVLVTSNTALLHTASFDNADASPATAPASFRTWTDNYSNVIQIFRFK
jgi:hypothetical protein